MTELKLLWGDAVFLGIIATVTYNGNFERKHLSCADPLAH